MAAHRMERKVRHLSKRQLITLVCSLAAVIALIVAGALTANSYKRHSRQSLAATQGESFDVIDGRQVASRSTARSELRDGVGGAGSGTSYVRVSINGHSRLVFGSHFTTVKSVLQQAGITLEPTDEISPSLSSKVTEKTVITITRAGTSIETVDTDIDFNTIKKDDPSLPKGTQKVKTRGRKGVMEATNLVQKAGSRRVSVNTLASWVKRAPVNKVILVGTGTGSSTAPSNSSKSSSSSSSSSSSNSSASKQADNPASEIGTTMPVGDAQSYAHQQVRTKGWGEDQFTCLVQLWQRESGWRVNAANPSGAYGIPQALPGSKMGAGWQTDAKVQINWGLGYIQGRYQTPCGAWAHSNATGWY